MKDKSGSESAPRPRKPISDRKPLRRRPRPHQLPHGAPLGADQKAERTATDGFYTSISAHSAAWSEAASTGAVISSK
jgi:hypothetical protein